MLERVEGVSIKQKLTSRTLPLLKPQDKPYEVWDTEIKGFLLRIQPSGSMTYYLFYRNSEGRKRRYKIGNTTNINVTRARGVAKNKAADVTKGIDVAEEKKLERTRKINTLGEYIEGEYSEWLHAHRRSAKDTLHRLKRCFGDWYEKDMLDITAWIVEKWRVQEKKRGKKPQTINREVGALKPVFKRAKNNNRIPINPLQDLTVMDAPNPDRVRYLSPEEEKRLRQTLKRRIDLFKVKRENYNKWRKQRDYPPFPEIRKYVYPDPITPMILLTLNTGVRQSQLFRLKWKDINFKEKIMSVTTYKGAKTRVIKIPLNSEAVTVMKDWVKAWNDLYQNDEDLVFPNSKTGKALTSIKTVWQSILKDAKIKDFWWRDMRHHAASWLLMAGVALEVIQQILGHRDIKTTQRYAHVGDEYKLNAVEKLVNRD